MYRQPARIRGRRVRDSTARHLCRRGLPARASALARTTSGSRGSGGRASPQSRSRRALGLWIRMLFTVISSASRHVRARLTSGPGPVLRTGSSREGMSRRRGGASPEGAHAGGIFGGPPGGTTVPPGATGARRCRGDRAAGAGLGDQAELAVAGDGLGAVGRAELAEQVADVLLTVSRLTTSFSAMRGFWVPAALPLGPAWHVRPRPLPRARRSHYRWPAWSTPARPGRWPAAARR